MRVTLEQAFRGVVAYLSDGVAKMSNPVGRFAASFVIGSMAANEQATIAKYKPFLDTSGVIGADGCIDLENVQKGFENAFAAVPTFTAFGFDFSEADIKPILERMRMYA